MSDLPPELPRPAPPRTWRDHLARATDLLDLSPRRVAVGVVALACVGAVGWRMLAPPPAPAEMRLPFAASSEGSVSPGGGETAATAPSAAGDVPTDAPGGSSAGVTTTGLPTELVVHVVGAVAAPGVQRLRPGSRVVDAIAAAGDALPDADLARVNLAALLVDGQQVYVPKPGEPAPAPLTTAGGGSTAGSGALGGGAGAPGALVDINSATADQLDTLPGVGPSTAAAIIAHRDQNGPFTSVEQLIDVRGIGDAKLEQLRDLVTV